LIDEPIKLMSAEQAEWEHLQQVLKSNDGNISATARHLSMHRRTLQRKLKNALALTRAKQSRLSSMRNESTPII